jgi:uncharacterized protein YkwD
MGFSSALLGGAIGFSAQCFSNYAMKIPLSRSTSSSLVCLSRRYARSLVVAVGRHCMVRQSHKRFLCSFFKNFYLYHFFAHIEPWMHALLFTVGCYAGDKYPKVEQRLVEQTNELRAKNGLPPLVGTKGWIRYQPQESTK